MPRHFDTTFDVVRELKPSYPVYCLRPDILRDTAKRFVEMFPGNVLYAVKCNPHPEIMRYLHEGGVRHFDTASPEEIALVRRQFPGMNAYFMHPVKSRDAIRSAHRVFGIKHYVIDTEDELEKIRAETDGETDLVIHVRLATPPAGAAYNLSAKFGARPMVPGFASMLDRNAQHRMGTALRSNLSGRSSIFPASKSVILMLVAGSLGNI